MDPRIFLRDFSFQRSSQRSLSTKVPFAPLMALGSTWASLKILAGLKIQSMWSKEMHILKRIPGWYLRLHQPPGIWGIAHDARILHPWSLVIRPIAAAAVSKFRSSAIQRFSDEDNNPMGFYKFDPTQKKYKYTHVQHVDLCHHSSSLHVPGGVTSQLKWHANLHMRLKGPLWGAEPAGVPSGTQTWQFLWQIPYL